MLPSLPKQNKSAEADFGIDFRKWWGRSGEPTGAYELKHTRGADALPFSAVEGPQIAHARKISGDGVLMRVIGSRGEPDYIGMRGEPAWVVIRYPKFWCIIAMAVFVAERDLGERKSLLSTRAREIARVIIEV